jgi:hypothetical protein
MSARNCQGESRIAEVFVNFNHSVGGWAAVMSFEIGETVVVRRT